MPLFLNSFFLPATVTFVQSEVDPGARVISGALLLLVMNLIGLGLGPTFVGMASDFSGRNMASTHSAWLFMRWRQCISSPRCSSPGLRE